MDIHEDTNATKQNKKQKAQQPKQKKTFLNIFKIVKNENEKEKKQRKGPGAVAHACNQHFGRLRRMDHEGSSSRPAWPRW